MQISRDKLITIGLLLVILAGFAGGVFYPQYRKVRQLRHQIVQAEQKLQHDRALAETVPDLAREVEQLRRQHSNFDRRLPQQKELGEFLREISTTIAAERLTNQVIEPGSPTTGPLYNNLPIIMEFDGSFRGLANFLTQIDQMERLTRIERIRIEPSDDGQLQVEMQLNIYFTES